jgi:hypothetical protein
MRLLSQDKIRRAQLSDIFPKLVKEVRACADSLDSVHHSVRNMAEIYENIQLEKRSRSLASAHSAGLPEDNVSPQPGAPAEKKKSILRIRKTKSKQRLDEEEEDLVELTHELSMVLEENELEDSVSTPNRKEEHILETPSRRKERVVLGPAQIKEESEGEAHERDEEEQLPRDPGAGEEQPSEKAGSDEETHEDVSRESSVTADGAGDERQVPELAVGSPEAESQQVPRQEEDESCATTPETWRTKSLETPRKEGREPANAAEIAPSQSAG